MKYIKFKYILYLVFGLTVLYYSTRLLSCKPEFEEKTDVINQIDSLKKVAIELQEKQKQIEARDSVFVEVIDGIDHKIDNVKEKEIIVKEYYHTQTEKTKKYNPTQLDSFFKDRYNY